MWVFRFLLSKFLNAQEIGYIIYNLYSNVCIVFMVKIKII